MGAWRPGAGRTRPERRTADERRAGTDRRAPVVPPPAPADVPRVVKPTARQTEVLALIASGHTFDEIARALGIREQTVKNHSIDARHRLKARNLPQAVAEMVARGWLVSNRRGR